MALIFNIGVHMKNFIEYKEEFDSMMAWFNSWKVDWSKLHAFLEKPFQGIVRIAHRLLEPWREQEVSVTFKSDTTESFKTFTDYIVTMRANIQAQMQLKNKTSTWKWHDLAYANGTIDQYLMHTQKTSVW